MATGRSWPPWLASRLDRSWVEFRALDHVHLPRHALVRSRVPPEHIVELCWNREEEWRAIPPQRRLVSGGQGGGTFPSS